MFEVVVVTALAGALLMAALRVTVARREQQGAAQPVPFPARKRAARSARALHGRDRGPMRW